MKKENCFSSFLEFSDIYGQTFNLRIFGKDKFRTLIGGILSCISLMLMVSASLYFIIDLFQRKSLTVILNEDYNTIPINNFTNIPISFGLADFGGNSISTEGVYSLDVKMLHYKRILSPDGTIGISLEILPIKLEKCEIDKHFPGDQESWKTFNLKSMLCIPPNKYNLTLQGKNREILTGWSTLNVYVNKCDPQAQKCLNSTYTEKVLSNFVFMTAFLSSSIDHYNTTSPNSFKIDSMAFKMSNMINKGYQLSIKQTNYKTDNGFVFQDMESLDFFTSDRITMDISLTGVGELTKGQNMGKLVFENSASISNYSRSYIKGQAVMANIGGIVKAIMIITKIISEFLTRRLSYVNLSNSIFQYKFDDSPFPNKESIFSNHFNKKQVNPQISKFDTKILKRKDLQFNPKSHQQVSELTSLEPEIKSEIQLSILEFVCPMEIFRKNNKLKILEQVKKFIWKKLSVETIIEKNFKLDQLAKLVLNDNQIKEYNSYNKPIFEVENEEEIKLYESKRTKQEGTHSKPVQNIIENFRLALKN